MRVIVAILGAAALTFIGQLYLPALAQGEICPADFAGFLPPRIQIGARGRVMPGGSGNRVRSEPSTNAEQVGTISPGAEFYVLDGPRCDSTSALIWWYVRSDDGLEGWTAEGLADEYFIEPIGVISTSTPVLTATPRPTWTATPSPTPIRLPPLNLPELEVLSPDNLAQMGTVGEIPSTGPTTSLFLSPDMASLFTINRASDAESFANVYTFPDLGPVTQGLPLPGGRLLNKRGDVFFTSDSRWSFIADFTELYFYQPGAKNWFQADTTGMGVGYGFRMDAISFSDTGTFAAYFLNTTSGPDAEFDHSLCFFDTTGDTTPPERRLCIPQPEDVVALAFFGDGSRLLVGTETAIQLYDAASGELLQTFYYPVAPSGTIAILNDAETEGALPTVLISQEGYVLSVNLETGAERSYPNGMTETVQLIILSPDRTEMLFLIPTASGPNMLVVDVETKAVLYQTLIYDGEITTYSPNGTLAFVNNQLFETSTWQPLKEMRDSQNLLAFSSDGKMLFVRNSVLDMFYIYGVESTD